MRQPLRSLENSRPQLRQRGMQRDIDFERAKGCQFPDKRFVEQRPVGGEVKAVGREFFADDGKDFKELWMEKGLPFRNPPGQGIAHANSAAVTGGDERKLKFDILNCSKHIPYDGERIHPV